MRSGTGTQARARRAARGRSSRIFEQAKPTVRAGAPFTGTAILQAVDDAAFRRDRAPAGSRPRRDEALRATRVTVVVEACVFCATSSRYGSPPSTSRATAHPCPIASSSATVHRSRRKRSTSSRDSRARIASESSLRSRVFHECRPVSAICFFMLAR